MLETCAQMSAMCGSATTPAREARASRPTQVGCSQYLLPVWLNLPVSSMMSVQSLYVLQTINVLDQF